MFNKIAIFGILLIILVLIIVFIIIGLFRDYSPLAKIRNKSHNISYIKQYGGTRTIKDKYALTLENLENTFSKIKSMMLYYDYDNNIAMPGIPLPNDLNRDNTIVGQVNQYRILSYMAAKLPTDPYFDAITVANNVIRLTPYNIIPGICDPNNFIKSGAVAVNPHLSEAQYKQIFENVKGELVNAAPNRYFNADSDWISVLRYAPTYQPYKSLFKTQAIVATDSPWNSQIGITDYFNDNINKVFNGDNTKLGIKTIYENMAKEIDYFKSPDDSDIDYLFKAIKSILTNNSSAIADALNKAYSKSGSTDDGNSDTLPINENQLSTMIIDYITNSIYSQQIKNILEKIIELMEYSYNIRNKTWIDVYIKILCELISAEKKKDNISLQCMLDLYHIFFDPIGQTNNSGNIIKYNSIPPPNNILENKLTNIIITLIKTYQFKKTNIPNYYNNILGYNIYIEHDKYNLYDNIGLRFASLYRTTKTDINDDGTGNSIDILTDTNTPAPAPLLEVPTNLSIQNAIDIKIQTGPPDRTFNTLANPANAADNALLNNLLITDLYAFKEYHIKYNAATIDLFNVNESLTPIFYKLDHTGNKYYFYMVDEIFNSKYFYAKYLIQKMMISKNFIAGLGGFVYETPAGGVGGSIHYTITQYKTYVKNNKNKIEAVAAAPVAGDYLNNKDFLYINAMYAMNTMNLAINYNIKIAAGTNCYNNIDNYIQLLDHIVHEPLLVDNYILYIKTYQKLLIDVLYDNILINISKFSQIDNAETIELLLYKIYKLERFHFNNTPSLQLLTTKIINLYHTYKMILLNAADLYADINKIVNMTKTLDFTEFQRPNLSNYLNKLLITRTNINWTDLNHYSPENYYSFHNLIRNNLEDGLVNNPKKYYSTINDFIKHNNILYLYKKYFNDIKTNGKINADIDISNNDYLQLNMKSNSDISFAIYLLLAPEDTTSGIPAARNNLQKYIINNFNTKIYNDDHEIDDNKKYPSKAKNSIITSNIFHILNSVIPYNIIMPTWSNMNDGDDYILNNAYITRSMFGFSNYTNALTINENFDARGLFYSMMKTNIMYKAIISPPGNITISEDTKKIYSDIGIPGNNVIQIRGDNINITFNDAVPAINGLSTIFKMNQYYYTNYLMHNQSAILAAGGSNYNFFPVSNRVVKNLFTPQDKINLIMCGLYNYTPYVNYKDIETQTPEPLDITKDILRNAFKDIYNMGIKDITNLSTMVIDRGIYGNETYLNQLGKKAIDEIIILFNQQHLYDIRYIVINLLKLLVKYTNKSVKFYLSFIHEELINMNELLCVNDSIKNMMSYLNHVLSGIRYFRYFCCDISNLDNKLTNNSLYHKIDYKWHHILVKYPYNNFTGNNTKLNRAIELIPILDMFYKSIELDMYLYKNELLKITKPIFTTLYDYISNNINNNNDHHIDITNAAADSMDNKLNNFNSFILERNPYISRIRNLLNIQYDNIIALENKSYLINGLFNRITDIAYIHNHIGRNCILTTNIDNNTKTKIDRRINIIFNNDYTEKRGYENNIIKKLKSISMGEYYKQWKICKKFILAANGGSNAAACDLDGMRSIFGDISKETPPMSIYHRLVETIKQICVGLSFNNKNNTMAVANINELDTYLKTVDPAALPAAQIPLSHTIPLQNDLNNLPQAEITALIASLIANAKKGQTKIGGSNQNTKLDAISRVFSKNANLYISRLEDIHKKLSTINWKTNKITIWINKYGNQYNNINQLQYNHIQIYKKNKPLFEIQKSENITPNRDNTQILQHSFNNDILKSYQKHKNFKLIGYCSNNAASYILYDSKRINHDSVIYKYKSLNKDEYWVDGNFFSIIIKNNGYRSGIRIDTNGNLLNINIQINDNKSIDIYDNIPTKPLLKSFTIINSKINILSNHGNFFIYSNGELHPYIVKLLPIVDSHYENNIFKETIQKMTDITIDTNTIFNLSPTLIEALYAAGSVNCIPNNIYQDTTNAVNSCNYSINTATNILYKPEAALFWGQITSNTLLNNEVIFEYNIINKQNRLQLIGATNGLNILDANDLAIGTSIDTLKITLDNDFTYEYNINTGKNFTVTDYFIYLIRQAGKYRYELNSIKELNYYAEKNKIFNKLIETLKELIIEPYIAPVSWYDMIDDSTYELDPTNINRNETILTELQRKIEKNPNIPINIINRTKDRVMGLNFRPSPKSRFNPKKHTIEEILKRIKKGDDIFEGHYWIIDDDYFSKNQELVIGAGHKRHKKHKKQIKN